VDLLALQRLLAVFYRTRERLGDRARDAAGAKVDDELLAAREELLEPDRGHDRRSATSVDDHGVRSVAHRSAARRGRCPGLMRGE